jgi:hypothetical protein
MIAENRYLLSYTGASLSVSESVAIAEVYLRLKDWDATEKRVKDENLIQGRTKSSIQRVYQEIAPRLQELNQEQLALLVDGNLEEQKQLLWYAICKRYDYIREFAIEVVHEKFLRFDHELTAFDYDAFFNRKADWHPELDRLADSTKRKLKSRLFRMLYEAGLTTEDGILIPALLSSRLVEVLAVDAPMSYKIFPMAEPNKTK